MTPLTIRVCLIISGCATMNPSRIPGDTVFDKLPSGLPRLLSVGRLDLASEGLLLFTNDGALKRRLELPQTAWVRRYRVRAWGKGLKHAFEGGHDKDQ